MRFPVRVLSHQGAARHPEAEGSDRIGPNAMERAGAEILTPSAAVAGTRAPAHNKLVTRNSAAIHEERPLILSLQLIAPCAATMSRVGAIRILY